MFTRSLMKKNKHIITVLLLSAIASALMLAHSFKRHAARDTSRFKTVVFSVSNGWGYDILVDDSLFIHQASIPGYGNGSVFTEKEQAQQAAKLVLKKLKSGEGLPTLSRFEIESIRGSAK